MHEGPDAALAMDAEWDALALGRTGPRWFQAAGWYLGWMAGVAESEGAHPVVVRIEDRGRLRAGLALQISPNGTGRRTLTALSTPWADYHDAVGDPDDHTAADTLATRVMEISQRHAAVVRFTDVMPGGLLDAVARRLCLSAAEGSTVSAIRLDRPDPWRGECDRNEFRIKHRRLQRLGTVACVHETRPAEIARMLPDFIAMHRAQWHDRPDAVAPFDDPAVVRGFEVLSDHLSRRGELVLTCLTLSGRPVAMYFGFRHGTCYGGYRTAFDQDLFRLSPGHLMLHRMIADFAADGVTTLDLMRGAYTYKNRYTNSEGRTLTFYDPAFSHPAAVAAGQV